MKLRLCVAPLLLLAASFACGGSESGATPTPSTTNEAGTPSEEEDGGSSTEDAATDTTTAPLTCPKIGASTVAATVAAPAVNEASGVALSTKNPGVYWVHNDSGDSARAFALGADGKLLATLSFDTTMPIDIEDMAIEDQGGSSFLYFGDIGDNPENRASITIHRVAEPALGGGPSQLTATSEKMTVKYVDGSHNAETLLFDPITKDLLIATKKTGGPSAIHRIGAFAAGTTVTTTKIADVDIPLATGGEISRDGRRIAIRGYPTVYLWTRNAGESLATALARPPCTTSAITGELQGEALAFFPDNKRFVTLSEGAAPKLNVHALE